MKAFLIDPGARQVSEVSLKPNDNSYVNSISSFVGCNRFEYIYTFDTGDGLYVDNEGLKNRDYLAFFIKDCRPPVFGKGLVVGVDKNKIIPPKLTQQAIEKAVSFLDKAQTEVIRKERLKGPSFHMYFQSRMADLTIKYVTGSLTDQEKEELNQLLASSPEKQKFFEELIAPERLIREVMELGDGDVEAAWRRFSQSVSFAPDSDLTT
jgi:hypothetical protein